MKKDKVSLTFLILIFVLILGVTVLVILKFHTGNRVEFRSDDDLSKIYVSADDEAVSGQGTKSTDSKEEAATAESVDTDDEEPDEIFDIFGGSEH